MYPPSTNGDGPAPDAAYRLPRTVKPVSYTLTLSPLLEPATFSGTAEIELDVTEPVSEVICNAAELVIHEASLEWEGRSLNAEVELDETNERATFSVTETVAVGKAVLRCSFSGVLNERLRGFYRSTFVDEGGQARTIATTQMEATDARRAFPCWDEPDRKAVFKVTLVVEPELAAFSNSPVENETEEPDGRRRVRFMPTMKMSTYLVACIVGPLETTDPVLVDGTPVRVVHVPGRAHMTSFALEVAQHALKFFSSYFDIAYPADKLDLVAIPDFAFGAMENLGCVTFRETALLVDPRSAARSELERVADVVAHEIAHMWFGDLVTMRWWEGIWLNEAFATFMEIVCVDAFRPEWDRWVSFGLEREAALNVDGLLTTRPIEYPVGSPEEAEGMFDVLTYQKGGSVLRMLEQYLGETVFRDGVRAYLRDHSYANTVTSDLWDALEAASGEPVRALMDSWILQGGHPMISIDDGGISQSPFSYQPIPSGETATEPASSIGTRWQVPVMVRELEDPSRGSVQRLLLTDSTASLERTEGGTSVLNAGGWGVYRSGYTPEHLARLANLLGRLEPLERSILFADSWAMVLAGYLPLEQFFELGLKLGDDSEPSTFSALAGSVALCDRVVTPEGRPQLAAATRVLLGRRAEQLGWERQPGEGERIPTLRSLLIDMLGTIGESPVIRTEAARLFDAAPGSGMDADIESAVLDVVAAQMRPGDHEAFLARYRDPATPQEELRYLTALAGFPDVDLSLRTFELALSEVRTQNAPYLIVSLLANRVSGPAVWERLKETWSTLLDKFPVNSHSRMLSGVRTLCQSEELAEDVTRFLTDHPIRSGQRSVEQALERLTINVAFGARYREELPALLARVDHRVAS